MNRSIACGAALAALGLSASLEPALGAEADSRASCEALAALGTDGFRVDAAEWVETSATPAGGAHAAGPPQARVPAQQDWRENE